MPQKQSKLALTKKDVKKAPKYAVSQQSPQKAVQIDPLRDTAYLGAFLTSFLVRANLDCFRGTFWEIFGRFLTPFLGIKVIEDWFGSLLRFFSD